MLKIERLVKAFGAKHAVDDVSFTVERGEVLGFLGPNGAGKSTTMRMITGFIPPTAGTVKVGGHDILAEPIPAKRLIGYLPENAAAYPDMSVLGFLGFAADMRGLAGDARNKAIARVVELCFLDSVLHQQIDTLSKGYRHRTCLAQALIHDPDVLVLDEPTDGLDPNQKHEVRNLIRDLGTRKAVIFSTHILEEVDAACTRAIIIDRGRIVANGTPAELRAMSGLAGAVTLKAAGADPDRLTVALVQFAVLWEGGQKKSMSTRAGQYVTLRELRHEVGNDACRFFYVLRKSDQHLDFDLDLAKSQSNDNPVYYIQYAHARISRVLDAWGGDPRDLADADLSLLEHPQELALLGRLAEFPETCASAARELAPHLVAYYLKDLAADLHGLYVACQFLVDDETLKLARLALIVAPRQTLKNGLALLGVSAPDTM